MTKTKTQSKDDRFAVRARAIYMRRIKPRLVNEKEGRVVALDVKSADYQVADTAIAAAEALLARRPKAQVWLERIGYPALYSLGSWGLRR